jgi:hypothetical protein
MGPDTVEVAAALGRLTRAAFSASGEEKRTERVVEILNRARAELEPSLGGSIGVCHSSCCRSSRRGFGGVARYARRQRENPLLEDKVARLEALVARAAGADGARSRALTPRWRRSGSFLRAALSGQGEQRAS